MTNLGGALEVLRTIAVDVVVGSNGLLELVADDHAGTLGCWTTRKEHDASASIRKSSLQLGQEPNACIMAL